MVVCAKIRMCYINLNYAILWELTLMLFELWKIVNLHWCCISVRLQAFDHLMGTDGLLLKLLRYVNFFYSGI